jgi:hypothetical protein
MVFIVCDLSLVGLACRDDAVRVATLGVDEDKDTPFNLSHESETVLAILPSGIGLNDSIGIEERAGSVGKVETPLPLTHLALGLVPFEDHEGKVVH